MATASVLDTDLLTPLGAYLRLRERQETRGAFLLESVERGRLGRYSFVGCGSRLVSFDEADALGEPVVGYLGYDFVATLEPTVAVPKSTTVPLQTVVENLVHVRVNVTPAGADITFTVPSVNRVCAASPDV